MQSCLALRFLVKRENDGARGRLMNIYFLSNIGSKLACMRTSRKTSARLKITFVDMTYPKGWTGSLPLCPLIFSCFQLFCWVLLFQNSKKSDFPVGCLKLPSIRVQLFASPIVNLLSLFKNLCFVEEDLKSKVDCTSYKLNKKGNVTLRDGKK